MATNYEIEPVEFDGFSFGRGDGFWIDLVTRLWTKRGEHWNDDQDAYQVGAIVVEQSDVDVLEAMGSDEARFVKEMLGRTSGAVRVTRCP